MTGPVQLANDSIEVEVLPAIGARLHRLRAFGHDLLRTPVDPAEHEREPFFWGGYHMAPWCNRISALPTRVADRVVDVGANFADGSAIHGQVHTRPWSHEGGGRFVVAAGGDGWPWPYSVAVGFSVAATTLTVSQAVTNEARSPMPAGVGFHPWFRAPLELAIHAARVIERNVDAALPDEPVHGNLDLRRMGRPADDLDATWLDVDQPAVDLSWPDIHIGATIRTVPAGAFVVAATPSSLQAVAVEPQTHAPGGLRRLVDGQPGAMAVLAPGATLTLRTDITFSAEQEG
jgi:aldose 1-epimerase